MTALFVTTVPIIALVRAASVSERVSHERSLTLAALTAARSVLFRGKQKRTAVAAFQVQKELPNFFRTASDSQ